jgi:RNA polymerase sigma factor (sigma-70 family)
MILEGLDAELVEAAQAGSSVAFGRLVDRHQRAVRAFLRRACVNPDEADDLAQEAFITAWSRIGRYRGEASVRSWLCGIAWRKCATRTRSVARGMRRDAVFLELEGLQRGGDPDAAARLSLEKALAGLPMEQRAVVGLCLAQDFSHSEAAEILGLPLGTVKSHVARGRARLAAALGGDDVDG